MDWVKGHLSTRVYLDPGGRMDAAKSLQGGDAELVASIERWAEVGVSHLILEPVAGGGAQGRMDLIRRFVGDVRPLIAEGSGS